jgi:hypothetical protein
MSTRTLYKPRENSQLFRAIPDFKLHGTPIGQHDPALLDEDYMSEQGPIRDRRDLFELVGDDRVRHTELCDPYEV